jgi:hypothetical protein
MHHQIPSYIGWNYPVRITDPQLASLNESKARLFDELRANFNILATLSGFIPMQAFLFLMSQTTGTFFGSYTKLNLIT